MKKQKTRKYQVNFNLHWETFGGYDQCSKRSVLINASCPSRAIKKATSEYTRYWITNKKAVLIDEKKL